MTEAAGEGGAGAAGVMTGGAADTGAPTGGVAGGVAAGVVAGPAGGTMIFGLSLKMGGAVLPASGGGVTGAAGGGAVIAGVGAGGTTAVGAALAGGDGGGAAVSAGAAASLGLRRSPGVASTAAVGGTIGCGGSAAVGEAGADEPGAASGRRRGFRRNGGGVSGSVLISDGQWGLLARGRSQIFCEPARSRAAIDARQAGGPEWAFLITRFRAVSISITPMPTTCTDYAFNQIEPHWQKFWDEQRTFRAETGGPRPKFYVLDMFPYPSGAGLHIGHPEGYTATDIVARYKRAKGFNVLHPIGWDSFGLPAEQHAVKTGTHPATNTAANIANFKRQIKALGFSYDWDRELATTDEKYYRWTQWIFLQLFQRGLAYVDERPVWWCPELRTVLANEEVVDGKSEVGGFPVERRNLRQWVLRITAYAERLLADLKDVDWPDSTKRMQEAWIGRSEGAEVSFEIERRSGFMPDTSGINPDLQKLKVFTTRPDTLFGCTYMVLAPEHPLVDALTTPEQRDAVAAYRRKAAGKSDLERTDLAKEKSGVFTGAYAINPVNGERVPVWIADYVLTGYGTGAIMAVPAHDERDWEFAKQYDLPMRVVIEPSAQWLVEAAKRYLIREGKTEEAKIYDNVPAESFVDGLSSRYAATCYKFEAFTGEGLLKRSSGTEISITGLPISQAKQKITEWLEAKGLGKKTVTYKLRDWLFSRQRYWGEPFPIVWVSEADYRRAAAVRTDLPASPVTFAQDGVTHFALPLPAGALPLTLPEVSSYLPSGNGESPLANVTDWLEIWFNFKTGESLPAAQPQPAGEHWVRGRRETNTMPQWAGSCWYYLRFADPANDAAFASPEALRYWGVPDLYVGGAEHAVLHLLYARFWHKVLFDLGVVPQSEPFTKLFHQGIILGEDGEKMSKSRGNVVSPDTIIASHGTDTLRLYLMFLGPLEAMKPWSMQQIEGVHRFLHKVWRECLAADSGVNPKISATAAEPAELTRLLHETIKKVGDDIEALRFNTAISQMMIFANALQKAPAVSRATVLAFLQVLAPFAPHLAEELWARLGGGEAGASIQHAPWPQFDAARLVVTEQKIVVQINGKHRGEIMAPAGAGQDEVVALAQKHERVTPFIAGKSFKRIIFVPGKILNIVVEQ